MGTIKERLDNLRENEKLMEFVRFCIIGAGAAVVHYGIYFLLQLWIDVNIAYTAGYALSFIGNFFLTTYFTFHSKPSWSKFIGFASSHALNYFLHIVLFNALLWMGVHRLIAPPLVMLIAMLVQFSVLRFIYHYKRKSS